MKIYCQRNFAEAYPQTKQGFKRIMALEGKVYRQGRGRRTIQFDYHGKSYFAKIHTGVGWREILKNLIYLRLPIINASNEWKAIQRLHQVKLDTMNIVAYGKKGWNPAAQQSFVITEALQNTISLEDLCKTWSAQPPSIKLKRNLIDKLATIARTLHSHGMNHRDFYLCHFLLNKADIKIAESSTAVKLYLIDLHRVQIRPKVPKRWLIKDISGLYFSAMDCGLTSRDLWRFLTTYMEMPVKKIYQQHQSLLRKINRRAQKQYLNG